MRLVRIYCIGQYFLEIERKGAGNKLNSKTWMRRVFVQISSNYEQ